MVYPFTLPEEDGPLKDPPQGPPPEPPPPDLAAALLGRLSEIRSLADDLMEEVNSDPLGPELLRPQVRRAARLIREVRCALGDRIVSPGSLEAAVFEALARVPGAESAVIEGDCVYVVARELDSVDWEALTEAEDAIAGQFPEVEVRFRAHQGRGLSEMFPGATPIPGHGDGEGVEGVGKDMPRMPEPHRPHGPAYWDGYETEEDFIRYGNAFVKVDKLPP